MDIKQVEKLLRAYAKRIPDEPVLTEQDIARFRARLAEAREAGGDLGEETEAEPPHRLPRRRLIWPLVGVTGLAAAAVIVFVFVLPSTQVPELPISLVLNAQVEARWPSTTRGPEPPPAEDPGGFTVRVSTNRPAFVHLIALMESGDLLVKQVAREEERPLFSRRVEQGESIGEYPLWYDPEDEPDRGLLRTTHVMIVAADEPIVQQLADALPPRIAAESPQDALQKLEELGQRLEKQLGCVVVVRAIEPSGP